MDAIIIDARRLTTDPIADTMTQAEIDAIVAAPGAIRRSIDQV
jgi:hypothetical protein